MTYLSNFKGRVVWGLIVVGVVLGVVSALMASDVGVWAQQATCPTNTGETAPVFVSGAGDARSVLENTPPGVNIGGPVTATDGDETTREYGETLTYSLAGTDASSFDIDASTGQIITKAALDAETTASYSVDVWVKDSTGNCVAETTIPINVTDVDEPPLAPAAPTVVSGPNDSAEESTTTLKVIWHAPENTGPSITDYDVEYKESAATTFTAFNHSSTDTTTTITGLLADTSYQVRVRATNGEADTTENWSLVGTGSTNKAGNSPPTFGTATTITRNVAENTSAGRDVGAPVTATDDDATTLTYRLEGPDAALFGFITSNGQIRTKAPLNRENPDCGYDSANNNTSVCSYNVTVAVVDGAGGSDAKSVAITVTDAHESVRAPARPTVQATDKSSTSLDVSWNAPANTGPPITGYKVQWRKGTQGAFANDNCGITGDDNCDNVTGTKTTILGLETGTSYQVRVTTIVAGGGTSAPSPSGTGQTNRANSEPLFSARSDETERESEDGTPNAIGARPIERSVDENTPSRRPVGRAVSADDGDGDKRTYKLVAMDTTDAAVAAAAKFDIDESTGQIRTKDSLNHEVADCGYLVGSEGTTTATTCTYTVDVQVWDGLDTDRVQETGDEPVVDDTIRVIITVRDSDEKPSKPTVTVTSPDDSTTLSVVWDMPANTGPTITGYDVQWSKGSGSFSDDNCGSTGMGNCSSLTADTRTTTIEGLEADTSYRVQVRAQSHETPSDWSGPNPVSVKTNKAGNTSPTFAEASYAFAIDENTPSGVSIGAVLASDSEQVTHKLEGIDAASFNINATSGDITTKSSLNYEEKQSYSVRVRASDGSNGGSAYRSVTIAVTDVPEAPVAPAAPTVRATADLGWSLDVTWNEPAGHAGKPNIIDYDIQYRKVGAATWQNWNHGATEDNNLTDLSITAADGVTDRTTKITRITSDANAAHLEARTEYEVQVRATNEEGTSEWSREGKGTTGAGNQRPAFDKPAAVITLTVDENTRSGQSVGSAVSASDPDSNRLTYTLEGPGADSFTIVSSSGLIRTKSPLDYEARNSYSVTVKVDDGSRRANSSAAKSVTITVNNVAETPSAPTAPSVTGIPGSTDSVRVTWDEPANTGPPITDYDIRYGEAGTGGFRLWSHNSADRTAIITGLMAGMRHDVQVRARSAEGESEYSRSGTGAPNPDAANRNPVFSGSTRTFNVAENESANTEVGAPVAATDADGDTLTYSLEGADAVSFNISSTSLGGQIRTNAALNHEEKASHSVTVRVTDGRGGSDTIAVTITVTDVGGEAPDAPFAPTVTTDSSTSIEVSWQAPSNSGPSISDYDYRYRESTGGNWTEVTNTTITSTTATIPSLTPGTSYEVQVRAKNDEGTGDWSVSGIGSTDVAGANEAPEFSETSTTRSVTVDVPAGTAIGAPVTATDPNPTDTLTYRLEGADALSFGINGSTGQLLTRSGITLVAGTAYSVTVVASDGTANARISVTVNVQSPDDDGSVTLSPSRPSVGDTVTARVSDPDGGVTGMTWIWESSANGTTGWTAISGATSATYTVAAADLNNFLRATASYTDAEGPNKSAEGVTAAAVAEDDDGSVSLSPSRPEVGETVTATLADPDGGVTGLTWQWATSTNGTSNWVIILGATSNSYTATAANQGSFIRATASYTDAVGAGKSAEGITAAAVAQDDDGVVTLSTSAPRVGSVVTASLSDPDGGVTGVTWQWEKSSSRTSGWTAIANATAATYVPRQGDLGSYLRATASYTDAVGSGKSAEAVTTSTVAAQALIGRYDANGNGSIEKSEALEAVKDYFADELSLTEVVMIIQEFFDS